MLPGMTPEIRNQRILTGLVLRDLRKGVHLSRKALSKTLGIYETTIQNVEEGKSGDKAIKAICNFFGFATAEEVLAQDKTAIRRLIQLRNEFTANFMKARLATGFTAGRVKLARAANLLETDVIDAEEGLASAEMMDVFAKVMGCKSAEELVVCCKNGILGPSSLADKVFLATDPITRVLGVNSLERQVQRHLKKDQPLHEGPEEDDSAPRGDIPVFDMLSLPAAGRMFSESTPRTLPSWLGESTGLKKLVAVGVVGSMMEPDYFHGDIVLCAEDALHEKGMIAVVRLANGEQGLAVVQAMEDGKILLSYKNGLYVPKSVSEEEIIFIAPVVKDIKTRRS